MKDKHENSKTSRDPVEIIRDINILLGELAVSRGSTPMKGPHKHPRKQDDGDYSGPSGGLKLLINEGFFRDSKPLPEVIAQLHQEGFKYPLPPIAVALLRLVRKRVLVRLPSKNQSGKKVWAYVERK